VSFRAFFALSSDAVSYMRPFVFSLLSVVSAIYSMIVFLFLELTMNEFLVPLFSVFFSFFPLFHLLRE